MAFFRLANTNNSSWYISAKREQGLLPEPYAPAAPALPLLLCHREIYGIRPLKSLLFTKLDQLQKLMDTDSKKHAVKISNILLWIATHHPEVLESTIELWKYGLLNVEVKYLYFPQSWESLEELVPTNALTTLLNSVITWCLEAFGGYVAPLVVRQFNSPLRSVRIGLGKRVDVASLIDILNHRRQSQISDHDYDSDFEDERIAIHLRCGEVDLKDLVSLPGMYPKVYISNVSDHDVAWVVQAATALQPKPDDCFNSDLGLPYIEALYLHHSKLTAAGFEAIAKGLFEAGTYLGQLGISSPYLDNDSEIPGYESSEEFSDHIAETYNFGEVKFFMEEDGLDQYYGSIIAYISDVSDDSRDDIASLLNDSMDSASLSDDSRDDIASLSDDSRNDIASLSDDSRDDIVSLSDDSRDDIASLSDDSRDDIAILSVDSRDDIASFLDDSRDDSC